MDPLSQLIGLLKPQAVGWRIIEAHDAWTLTFDPSEVVVFGQLLEGACTVERSDGIRFDVTAGDFMLMALPPIWRMTAGGGGSPVDLMGVIDDPEALWSPREAPQVTRFIAGYFTFDVANVELVSRLMPPIVHVRGTDVSAERLGTFLTAMGDEALSARPGRTLVLERFLEIILVEALRHSADSATDGLMAGLADAKAGRALQLMHDDARRAWTVAELARAAGMSRSAFAAHFARVVGVPPMDYLSAWRMTLARTALNASVLSMADIADLAGYQSVSAFSTAFKRAMGVSPSRYSRTLDLT